MSDNQVIPEAAVEAAVAAVEQETYGAEWARRIAIIAVQAAAPHMLAGAWQSAYRLGVDDERTSQSNPGIAGCFCHSCPCQCIIEPARENPYEVSK